MTSFEFKWNSSKSKVKGKVFAKKRKPALQKNTSVLEFRDDSKNAIFTKRKVPMSLLKQKHQTIQNSLDNAQCNKQYNKSHKFKEPDGSLRTPQTQKSKQSPTKETRDKPESTPYSEGVELSNKYSGLIKRKQKKDKVAAKHLRETNEGGENLLQPVSQTVNRSHSLFSEKHKDIHVNTGIKGKSVVEKVFSEGRKFSDLNIHKYVVSNLEKINFVTLTMVQEKSIPVVISGKNVLIRSQTGSGKTLAYAVPIIDALQSIQPRLSRDDGVQVIVIVPTRELALQTHELFGKINTFQWIVTGHLCGGENRNTEKGRLRKGVHVLIATPGRLLDHILHTAAFKTQNVRCLVLDEADRLLDMGFKKDIVSIVEELDKAKKNAEYNPLALLKQQSQKNLEETGTENKSGSQEASSSYSPLRNPISKERQTLLLSATLSKGIAELADFVMKDHVYIDALDDTEQTNVKHMVIPNTVKQEFIMTYVKHRLFTLSALLVTQSKQNSKVFVFMATSQMVDYHYELFTRCLLKMPVNRGKLNSGEIVLLNELDSDDEEEIVLDTQFFKLHGSMDQSMRKQIFTEFRAAKKGVLLCTDVAARGLDVPTADCIVQYNGPQSDDDYLHRVGRTGRAGKQGHAIIFLTHEEQDYLTRLQEYKVYLKQRESDEYLKCLCDLMEEPNHETAAAALQKRYEEAVAADKELQRLACLAYTSWSRFYNTYPSKMRTIFNFKNVNLGHYVTSFAIRDTPTNVARIVRGQMVKKEHKRLNRKLATHDDDQPKRPPPKRKFKSVCLTTSEYSSGLEPAKKKKKKT